MLTQNVFDLDGAKECERIGDWLRQALRRDLHRHGDSGGVIQRSRAQVPRIQVAGDNDHLIRRLAPLQICDDVEALDIRQRLRR